MRKTHLFIALLLTLPVFEFACLQKQQDVPSSPSVRSLYFTATPTVTPTSTQNGTSTPTWTQTGTPTVSATPTVTVNSGCPTAADVTANIDGADYEGDDTSHILSGAVPLTQGGTSTGDILSFTLASQQTLNFSLCPTESLNRSIALYVRSNCVSSSGETFNGGYCAGLPQITNLTLPAGTYYLIISEKTGSSPGPYSLRIKSGSVSSNVCTVSQVVTPVAVPAGTYTNCSVVYAFNGGAAASGQRIATGQLDDTTNTDDFYSFKPASSGPVTVTLDCFDNGLCNVDFDIVGASNCPTSGSPTIIGQSLSNKPLDQFVFTGNAGSTYYIDVEAYLGTGTYRLTVVTP